MTRAGEKGIVAPALDCHSTMLDTSDDVTWTPSQWRRHCSSKTRRQNGSLSTHDAYRQEEVLLLSCHLTTISSEN